MGTLKVPVTQHDHIKGPANAPVTLVEYGDLRVSGLRRRASDCEAGIRALRAGDCDSSSGIFR